MKRILCIILILGCINLSFINVCAKETTEPTVSYGEILKSDGTIWYLAPLKTTLKAAKRDGIDNVETIYDNGKYFSKKDGSLWEFKYSEESGRKAYQVQGISNVKDIETKSDCTIAVKKDGTVWWWGTLTVFTSLDSNGNWPGKYCQENFKRCTHKI